MPVLGLVTISISIAELATLITSAGMGIYVLGLVGVALSIHLTFARSWPTAWYTASLMPRVVVAGQGMRLWWRGMINVLLLLVTLVVVSIIDLGLQLGIRRFLDLDSQHPLTEPLDFLSVSLVFLFSVAYMLLMTRQEAVMQTAVMQIEKRPQPAHFNLRAAVILAVIGSFATFAAIYVIGQALSSNSAGTFFPPPYLR